MPIDDVPVIESMGRLGRRPPRDSTVADAYVRRRTGDDLGRVANLPAIMRIAEMMERRVFPDAALRSDIQAAGPSYTMYLDCGPYNYNGTCDEACFGFEPHHMDPFYCATCDEQAADPVNNPSYNWHFVGSRGTIQYIDREPDVCAGRDAWKWDVGACGQCSESAVYRCHDGYKKYPGNDSWDPTICAGLVSCDGDLNLC